MTLEELSHAVIGIALGVHSALGPGLVEIIYEKVLAARLDAAGIPIERQVYVSFTMDGITFVNAFRIDVLVDGRLALELKAQNRLLPLDERQLLTYLRAGNLPMGLLMNFGGVHLRDGIRRILNSRYEAAPSGSTSLLPSFVASCK